MNPNAIEMSSKKKKKSKSPNSKQSKVFGPKPKPKLTKAEARAAKPEKVAERKKKTAKATEKEDKEKKNADFNDEDALDDVNVEDKEVRSESISDEEDGGGARERESSDASASDDSSDASPSDSNSEDMQKGDEKRRLSNQRVALVNPPSHGGLTATLAKEVSNRDGLEEVRGSRALADGNGTRGNGSGAGPIGSGSGVQNQSSGTGSGFGNGIGLTDRGDGTLVPIRTQFVTPGPSPPLPNANLAAGGQSSYPVAHTAESVVRKLQWGVNYRREEDMGTEEEKARQKMLEEIRDQEKKAMQEVHKKRMAVVFGQVGAEKREGDGRV